MVVGDDTVPCKKLLPYLHVNLDKFWEQCIGRKLSDTKSFEENLDIIGEEPSVDLPTS